MSSYVPAITYLAYVAENMLPRLALSPLAVCRIRLALSPERNRFKPVWCVENGGMERRRRPNLDGLATHEDEPATLDL
jgi:hypothetical protein